MSVMSLYPYLKNQDYNNPLWVFDDEAAGLKAEAFVSGMSEMITAILLDKGIPHAAQGFKISFSNEPFDHDVELEHLGEEEFQWEFKAEELGELEGIEGLDFAAIKAKNEPVRYGMLGNWYEGEVAGQWMEGWLCPALLLYFKEAPAKLYVKAEPLPEGIDPIWHDANLTGRRFVGAEV